MPQVLSVKEGRLDRKTKTGLSYERLRYEKLRSETVEEKTEEQKEGAGLFTWHGTVLYRHASEYKSISMTAT